MFGKYNRLSCVRKRFKTIEKINVAVKVEGSYLNSALSEINQNNKNCV